MIRDRLCKWQQKRYIKTLCKQHQLISPSLPDVTSFPLMFLISLKAIVWVFRGAGGDRDAGDRQGLMLWISESSPPNPLCSQLGLHHPSTPGCPTGGYFSAKPPGSKAQRGTGRMHRRVSQPLAKPLQRKELKEPRLLSLSKGQRR